MVVGLPRGGVPVAFEVATALDARLDVIVVRKLGVPFQHELAMGAIGEGGAKVLDRDVIRITGVTSEEIAEVEARERLELDRRANRFRAGRDRVPLLGHTVVIVDDGVATGSSARAACEVARAQGASRVVLAVPVAPADWIDRLGDAADEYVCVENPPVFYAVGQFYERFPQIADDEVVSLLARRARAVARGGHGDGATPARSGEVTIDVDDDRGVVSLRGVLAVPEHPSGLVVFVHGSGSSRHSPRNRSVATVLGAAGLATLLVDLLTPDEEADRVNVFDIDLLAARLRAVTRWTAGQEGIGTLPVGWFGASTGAAAALRAAADPGATVAAVVSRGGRPDLAEPHLDAVRAPTLLIVGGEDHVVLRLNRHALPHLGGEAHLLVIPGATHLFEEPGTLRQAAEAARDWFLRYLR